MGERDAVVQARGVCLRYGATVAVDHADLTVLAGESVALMGPSGSGKSSLLHCLAGVLPPDSGEVAVDGVRLDRLSERHRSRLRLTRMGMTTPRRCSLHSLRSLRSHRRGDPGWSSSSGTWSPS